jgi:hypothetical protein
LADSFHESDSAEHPAIGAHVEPLFVELSKRTTPVGPLVTSPPGGSTVTVASTVIVCPFTEGLGDVWTDVAVAAAVTVWVTGAEVDPVKFASPG